MTGADQPTGDTPMTMPKLQFDPLNEYLHKPQYNLDYLREWCGLLVPWAQATPETSTMRQELEHRYQSELYTAEGVTITADGVYQHPADNDLPPIAKLTFQGETLFIYPYAMVAFVNSGGSGETFVSRMD
jgi:hypothetical protein